MTLQKVTCTISSRHAINLRSSPFGVYSYFQQNQFEYLYKKHDIVGSFSHMSKMQSKWVSNTTQQVSKNSHWQAFTCSGICTGKLVWTPTHILPSISIIKTWHLVF